MCGDMTLASAARGAAPTDALLRRFREDQFYGSLEALVDRVSALREGRTHVLLLSGGWEPGPPDPGLAAYVRGPDSARSSGRAFGGAVGGRIGHVDRAWCQHEIERLARVDFEERFRALATRASRTNVTFFPIDVGGLSGNAPGVETLRTLAENTDGTAFVNSNDLAAAFRRVGEELSAFYVLGYRPTSTDEDGRFREIRVEVRQPDVTVAARRGYYAIARAARPPDAGPTAGADEVARALESLARLGSSSGAGASVEARGIVLPEVNGLIAAPVLLTGAATARARLTRAAQPQLHRTERLQVLWPVVEPASYTARLLDRRGQPLPIALSASTAALPDGAAAVAVDLFGGALATGDYVLELVATRQQESVRSLLAFRVVR
jgi:hypothetical protein